MTLEEQLKQYIKDHYGSVRAFVLEKNLIYANVDSILRRGLKNATWNNVKTLCEALQISADDLSEGRIISTQKENAVVKAEDIITDTINRILYTSQLTIDDAPATQEDRITIAASLESILAARQRWKEYSARIKDDQDEE